MGLPDLERFVDSLLGKDMHWLTMYCSKLTGVSKNSGDFNILVGSAVL